jgi:hypothetical protein
MVADPPRVVKRVEARFAVGLEGDVGDIHDEPQGSAAGREAQAANPDIGVAVS